MSKILWIIFSAAMFFTGCKNQTARKMKKPDSVKQITDTTFTNNYDVIHDSIEKKISDTIASLPEIKAFATYLDTATKGKRRMLIFVSKQDSVVDGTTDYFVQVGEDNESMFVTHYNFYVNSVSFSVRYYDVINDSIISLEEWRRQVNKKIIKLSDFIWNL